MFLKDELHSEDEGSDAMMGKGKRKRFQNVRMLPIEELVEARRVECSKEMQDLRRKVLSIRRKGTKTDPGGISIEQELELIRGAAADKPGNCSPVTVDDEITFKL